MPSALWIFYWIFSVAEALLLDVKQTMMSLILPDKKSMGGPHLLAMAFSCGGGCWTAGHSFKEGVNVPENGDCSHRAQSSLIGRNRAAGI